MPEGRRRNAFATQAGAIFEEDFAGRILPVTESAVAAKRKGNHPPCKYDNPSSCRRRFQPSCRMCWQVHRGSASPLHAEQRLPGQGRIRLLSHFCGFPQHNHRSSFCDSPVRTALQFKAGLDWFVVPASSECSHKRKLPARRLTIIAKEQPCRILRIPSIRWITI